VTAFQFIVLMIIPSAVIFHIISIWCYSRKKNILDFKINIIVVEELENLSACKQVYPYSFKKEIDGSLTCLIKYTDVINYYSGETDENIT
jgi:hypothetical protein